MKTQSKTNTKVLFFILAALNAIFALYTVSALAHDEHHLDSSALEEIRAHEEELLDQDTAAITTEDMYEDDFELLPDTFI
ncbi:MAG: hypothetical protein IT287_08160, partial [Bdellovibrionaceae bacterium]|nr:hypothetical protein [Pseudobdellovibrionaceae bacterium]